ncbi:ANKYRIN REPEAT FAMILY PROTEIN [Salix koriyanagi]|uniref:ANKYRIN REPEAT FAMILY PROTEIN n=2 Tax=Salix koriyanagi TaxID=2511006 RepID=A0A9Q0P720_9ROSI|nr:ANKYRIN REPEAT FAMILY PROTEIN [Salix koriyanagi]
MAPDASDALAVRQKVQQFLTAACIGNLDLLKNIAAQLAEGNEISKTVAETKDANKRGALHFAAREAQTEVCKYLIEELKLDVDTKDEDGETPLVHAARQGHTATAKYLLDQGADPSIPSDLGATALHHSSGIGNTELMEYLLSKGAEHHANPNSKTEDDVTPLLSAVAAGSLACLELLVQAGAAVNVTAGGATPLHVAADLGSPEILNRLLEAGADCNVTDEDGQKPIQVAAARGNREAVEILFPLTTKVQSIHEWTVDGILAHLSSEANKEEETRIMKGADPSENMYIPKRDLPELYASINDVCWGLIAAHLDSYLASWLVFCVGSKFHPEAKERAAEAKLRGDDAFRRMEYLTAVNDYTQSIDLDPTNATVLSNRSLCWMRLGQPDQALTDARACKELKPDWSKAWYREGSALRLLQRFEEAANSFYEGVRLDPENMELVKSFREAVDAGRKFHGKDQGKS